MDEQQLWRNIQMSSFAFGIVVLLHCQVPQSNLIIWSRSSKYWAVSMVPLNWSDRCCVVLEYCYRYTTVKRQRGEKCYIPCSPPPPPAPIPVVKVLQGPRWQCSNRPFYSCGLSTLAFEWTWGWRWPCFDTNLLCFVMEIVPEKY